jgi:hypothetical protein
MGGAAIASSTVSFVEPESMTNSSCAIVFTHLRARGKWSDSLKVRIRPRDLHSGSFWKYPIPRRWCTHVHSIVNL